MTEPQRPTHGIVWLTSLPFFIYHFLALFIFVVPFAWKWAALAAGAYFVRMFAITAGYHRYFAHRSYKMNRFAQFIMAFIGGASLQKGALWWAAHHRLHHRHSDTPSDVHSPSLQGFWWSHMVWFLSDRHEETHWDQIQDLAKYPELRWLNRWHWVPAILYGTTILVVFGWAAAVWGLFFSTVVLWHCTFSINSLAHVFGSQRYATGDTSRNSFLLAFITLGEGWHNNHHCYPSSARQGFFWWEIDVSYTLLRALSALGLVQGIRQPPLALLEAKRLARPYYTETVCPS